MEIAEFRKQAERFSHWIADYLETLESYPVRSQANPGEILSQLTKQCPDKGDTIDDIFADFIATIIPGITHWQHPRFFAYFSANSSPPSILAEILTAGLAAQCMLWETSPSATELELRMMEWLRSLLGLPEEFTGSIQDSGSSSNLCAILAGCSYATNGRAAQQGLAACGKPLAIYTSAEAHSSIEKGARIAGLGAEMVRKIPIRADLGMDPGSLRHAIETDLANGVVPACIVALFGGTGLGSIDPIRKVGEIAMAHDVHLHIDAAWAGSALILPEMRPLADGLEYADSFVFNPHKWLFTNFDCSAFYMRDPNRLTAALSLTPAYLESAKAGSSPEYRDWSIALGRRFRALKLWFVLRAYGADGLRTKLRSHIDWTRKLAEIIERSPDFELTSAPHFALLTFRYRGKATGNDTDAANEELLRRINDSGQLYLTKTRLNGRVVIRFAIGQTYTKWRHIEEGWRAVQDIADRL